MPDPTVFERVVAEALCAMGSCDRPAEATHDGWHLAQARGVRHALAMSDAVRDEWAEAAAIGMRDNDIHTRSNPRAAVDAIRAAIDPKEADRG
jgi:hypothetical protein